MARRPLKIGLLQHACPADREANFRSVERLGRQAAAEGARLIMTQELFAGPYFPQIEDDALFDLAESIPGPGTDRLGALARELKVWISASLFERRAAGLYHNTSVMIDPEGRITDRYRKMHIPDDPRFYEKYYFTPGDLGFRAQQVDEATTGMLVCWDQWFPEAARLTALRGAEVLMYPTAIGWYAPDSGGGETPDNRRRQQEAWRTIQRSHAVANGVYVAVANRIGRENDLVFWGSSFIADPSGQVIAEAPEDQEAVLTADLDLDMIESWRRGWPFLRDRRIDAYQNLTRRLSDEASEPAP